MTDSVPYETSNEDILLVSAFGVGWATPNLSEMVPVDDRPVLSIGAFGNVRTEQLGFVAVASGMAAPWPLIAQLAGQIDALKGKLPDDFMPRWREEFERSRAFADENLEKIRFYGPVEP